MSKDQSRLAFSLGATVLITCGTVALSLSTGSLLPLYWLMFATVVAMIATFISAYLPALAQKSLTWVLYILIVGALVVVWIVKIQYPEVGPQGVRNPLTGQISRP